MVQVPLLKLCVSIKDVESSKIGLIRYLRCLKGEKQILSIYLFSLSPIPLNCLIQSLAEFYKTSIA